MKTEAFKRTAVSHFMRQADQNSPPRTAKKATTTVPLVLDPNDPMATARRLLAGQFTHNDIRVLHYHRAGFYLWKNTRYVELDNAEMRTRVYTFSESARVTNSKDTLEPFKPSTRKIQRHHRRTESCGTPLQRHRAARLAR